MLITELMVAVIVITVIYLSLFNEVTRISKCIANT